MADFTGKRLISESILSDVADAIREKAEIDDKIMPTEYAELIRSLIGSGINDYYDSWRGVISPMDGTFQQSYYSNGVAIGDKIYFWRDYSHSHYNGDKIGGRRWYCYDTMSNTATVTEPECADGTKPWCSSLWLGSDGAIYGLGVPTRYKTTDYGATWTKDAVSAPSYDPGPVYKLSSGRIIGTMLARTRMLMISDDEGLTWETITPFTDDDYAAAGISGYISPSHGTICELDDCIALYFNSPMQVSDNSSKRYVSLSYDNGNTWTLPAACTGDLANAGWYLSPGSIVKFGRKYHYVCSNRYMNLKYSEDENYYLIGECLWFTGSANDVKNGTMKLRKKLSQTLFKSNGFDAKMAAQDVGNGGVTLCNGALYANYGNNIYNKDDTTRAYVSNSGIEMFRIGMDKEEDVAPYWDADFKTKYEEIQTAADTSYNYYFYAPDNTNINGVDWWGYEEKGYIPNEGSFKLPLGTGNFEINGIYVTGYLGLTTGFPRIFAGIEETNGSLHALGASAIGQYAIFDKANDNVPSGVLAGGSTTYFTFKRQDGVDTYTINGVTVTDPPFGWTYGTDSVLLGVDETSYVYNINASDDTVQTWIAKPPKTWDTSGLKMLTISCDADYHGTSKDFSVTYNLTGCSSSNTVTSVNNGRAYSTTITVNPGYELSGEITCTMGGVSQVVTNGVINIESVTGDIVITAIAEEVPMEPVTDGLNVCYTLDSYDAENKVWKDELGVGSDLTSGGGYNEENNVINLSGQKVMTMTQFSELYSNGWTMSFPVYCGNVVNNLFIMNSGGATGGPPYSTAKQFVEASGNNVLNVSWKQYVFKHYAWTYDANTNKYTMYINGVRAGSLDKTTAWSSNYLTLGGWGNQYGTIRMYTRALSDAEIMQNYNYDAQTWTFE